jgi:2-oxoglutarate ferredoxin oxidoreductase subunit beta
LGVIRAAVSPTYDQLLEDQIAEEQKVTKIKTVDDLLISGDTWEI